MALGSTNNFFKQPPCIIKDKRVEVENYLIFNHSYTLDEKNVYLAAFDYFSLFTSKFDGSTASKDLIDIEGSAGYDGLDLDAMLHDYLYLMVKVASNWKCLSIADRLFSDEIYRKNKASKTFGHFVVTNFYSWYKLRGLQILRPYIWIRSLIKYGKMKQIQKDNFKVIINIFGYAE